jgi:hypothetical protein
VPMGEPRRAALWEIDHMPLEYPVHPFREAWA